MRVRMRARAGYADRSKVWLARRMAPDRHPGCPGAPPANVRGHSTPITLATGERFSPTRFSLTGAHSTRGIHPQSPVRRAAKRKTLYVIRYKDKDKRYTIGVAGGLVRWRMN